MSLFFSLAYLRGAAVCPLPFLIWLSAPGWHESAIFAGASSLEVTVAFLLFSLFWFFKFPSDVKVLRSGVHASPQIRFLGRCDFY